MHKRFGNQQGLTLIEIIVSLAILGIIIVPIYTMFIISVKVDVNAKDQMIANQLAQQAMEKAKVSLGTGDTIEKAGERDEYTIKTTIADGFVSDSKRYKIIEPAPIIMGEKVSFNGTDLEGSDGLIIGVEPGVEVTKITCSLGSSSSTLDFKATAYIDLYVYYDAAHSRDITIANKTSYIVNLYIFSSTDTLKNATVTEGTVYTYPTITAWNPTSTVKEGAISIVDQITVSVSKTGVEKPLAEMIGLRNNY